MTDDRKGPYVVQMSMRDEDGFQFSTDGIIIRQAFQAVFFGMETGIQEKGKAVNFQKVRVGPNLLPAAKDCESPGH